MLRLISTILAIIFFQTAYSTPIVFPPRFPASTPLTIHLDLVQHIDCTHASGHIVLSASGGTPGYDFDWSDGSTGTAHAGLAAGDYTIIVTDAAGAKDEVSVTINDDKALPIADAGISYVVSCSNSMLLLTGTGSTGAGFAYQWTAENGGNIASGATTLQPTINKVGRFVLIVTNTQNGCTATDFTIVTAQNTAPVATALGDTLTCVQTQVKLSGGYNPLNTTIFWQGPNGYVSALPEPFVGVAGNYFFTVTDTLTECATKVKAIVLLDTLSPAVTVSATGSLSCQQTAVQILANAAPTGLKFNWAGPNNFTSNLQNPTVTSPGTYVLVVTALRNGCTALRSLVVAGSLGLPTANASVSGTLTCTNSYVTLNGSTNTPGASFQWSGPGGFAANTQNTSAAMPGIYTLTVKNNSSGCTATAAVTVQQNVTPPAVSATGGNKTCANPSVVLTASSVAGAAYIWGGPANFSSYQQNPAVTQLGTYTVTVTNPQNSCTNTAFANVGQNTTAPTVLATSGTVTCTVPQISLKATSNTPGINYAWSGPGSFTSTLSSPLAAAEGYYHVTVTSPQNGCTNASTTYLYKDNAPPTTYAGTDRSLNCFFTSVILNTTGSSMGSQYAYLWTTQEGHIVAGATTLQPRIDGVGYYQLKITNTQNGCTAVDNMELIQSSPVTANISQSQTVSCNGGNNGNATVVAGGGDEIYTYAWPNGATTPTITGLGAGTYKVTVTDSEGCQATATATITQPPVLTATVTANAQTIPNVNNGSATATPSGGTAPYTIKWNTNQVTFTIQNLAPATYTATVTDSKGCSIVRSVTVNQSSCALTGSIAVTSITCVGLTNGTATANITGAPNPITYKWSNNATTQTVNNLAAGNYTVTATDATGCPVTLMTTISTPQPLAVSIANHVNVSCPGTASGALSLNNSGGVSPYNYTWSNGATQSTVTGLASGAYTVTVRDANNCSKTTSATILVTDNQPPVLNLKNVTMALGANSLATVTAQMFDNGSVDLDCSIASWTITPTVFDCNKVGNNLVTLTATDNNGNSSSGTAIVTVQDNVVPVMNCPANITVGFCHPVVQFSLPQVIDNCPTNLENLDLTQGLPSGAIFPLGSTQQQFKYVDASGNLAACTFTVTVVSALLAEVSTVSSSCSGSCTGLASLQVIGGNSNFSVQWSNGQTSQQVQNLCPGAYAVTVQDAYGCSQTYPFPVTGGDTEAPVLVLHFAAVALNSSGTVQLEPAMFDAGSTDNCGIAAWTLEPAFFDCNSLGAQSVQVTVMDLNGNAVQQSVQVQVQDFLAPVLQCPANQSLAYCQPVATYSLPTITDNCTVNPAALQLISGLASGTGFPVNTTTTQTFSYMDAAGNSAQCSFNITVAGAPDVQFTQTAISCAGACDGQIALQVNGSGFSNFLWSNGQTGSTVTNLCPGIYNVTLSDGQDCIQIRSTSISQPVILSISVDALQNPAAGSSNGAIAVTINGGAGPYFFTWKRDGWLYSYTEDLVNLPAGQYSLLVTDAHGCTAASASLTLSGSVRTAEPDWAQHLRVQPNPARDQALLVWSAPLEEAVEVTISDVVGRSVQSMEADKNSIDLQLDLSALSPGLWLIQIRAADGPTVVRQLVIER